MIDNRFTDGTDSHLKERPKLTLIVLSATHDEAHRTQALQLVNEV